jgi:short-subunit dehydrogenase
MTTAARPLAVVTGASTGIGRGIARALAEHGYDLVIAADEPRISSVASELRRDHGAAVDAVEVDLGTTDGVRQLADRVVADGRAVDALVLNAGIGVEGPFVETDVEEHLRVLELNVVSPVHLAGLLLPAMVRHGEGHVLVTSSIADTMAGPRMSTYNASKTFLSAWSEAVRQELGGTGVTLTTLRPGGTDTDFFERADMEDSPLGSRDNDDPDKVAHQGVDAMLAGKPEVVGGPTANRLLQAAAKVLPDALMGKIHARAVEQPD